MSNTSEKPMLRNNPVFIIFLSCLIAAIMSTVGFLAYYGSDTRKTVEQIQINNLEEVTVEEGIDLDTGAFDADYIDAVEANITELIDKQSDETDFSATELTDAALGL